MSNKTILALLMLISFASVKAQSGRTYQEIGVMAGPVFFQGDFGERKAPSNTYKNMGVSAGVLYYLSLNNNRSSFADHFKLRFEASFMAVNLQHYGSSFGVNTNAGRQLRAMRSDVKMGSVGAQLEYYPYKTDDYSGATFSPYISAGTQLSSYSAKAYSFLGNIGTPLTVPDKYVDGFKSTSGLAFSVTGSIGFRYKLSDYQAIIVDGRLQYFFDDWVDGMNPDRRTYKENNTNDFSGTLYVGYVIYFY